MDASGPRLPLCEDAQLRLLGAMMRDQNIVPDVTAEVSSRHFSGDYRICFEVLAGLYADGEDYHQLPIEERLAKLGDKELVKRCAALLIKTFDDTFTTVYWRQDAKQLRKADVIRSLYKAGYELIEASQSAHTVPEEAIARAETLFNSLIAAQESNAAKSVGDVASEVIENIRMRMSGEDDGRTIKTGFYDLDRLTGGLRRTELTTLAARPGMGKTAFALNIASKVASAGRVVLFVSMEMADMELVERLLGTNAKVDSIKIRDGKLSYEEFEALDAERHIMSEMPVFISDPHTNTLQRIASDCRRLKMKHGLDLLIVDYMQLLTPRDPKQSRVEQVSEFSRGLKKLAIDLNIPVLCLSQLNRKCEERPNPNKRPMLADLRESGSIEQDSNNVWFLYRGHEYSEKVEDESKMPDGSGKRPLRDVEEWEAELIVAKQRRGPTDVIDLRWTKQLMEFQNLTNEEIEPWDEGKDF